MLLVRFVSLPNSSWSHHTKTGWPVSSCAAAQRADPLSVLGPRPANQGFHRAPPHQTCLIQARHRRRVTAPDARPRGASLDQSPVPSLATAPVSLLVSSPAPV